MVTVKKNIASGFSIMEILVAIILLGMALIPIFGMFIFGTRNTGTVTDIIVATNLATEKMELVKSKDFNSIVMNDADADGFGDDDIKVDGEQIFETGRKGMQYATSGTDINDKPIITYPEHFGRFSRWTTVETLLSPEGDEAMKIISVEVGWLDTKGEPVRSRVRLKTLVTNESFLYEF